MLKSMTAYSRSIMSFRMGRFVVELQTLNRKHLEIHTFLPKSLLRFDVDIKKWIGGSVFRGQVNVRVGVVFDQAEALKVFPNLPLAKQLKLAWEKLADHLELSPSQFTLEMLAKEEGILVYEEAVENDDEVRDVLEVLIAQALLPLHEMKKREGLVLEADIIERLKRIKHSINEIEKASPNVIAKFKERFQKRLQEALAQTIIDENDEKLIKEVCSFADKVDIAEEITRFNCHLEQFDFLLAQEREAIGKTLEFLVQELNREINTIASKSVDIEIAHLVIDVKGELERIREQIQNVE